MTTRRTPGGLGRAVMMAMTALLLVTGGVVVAAPEAGATAPGAPFDDATCYFVGLLRCLDHVLD